MRSMRRLVGARNAFALFALLMFAAAGDGDALDAMSVHAVSVLWIDLLALAAVRATRVLRARRTGLDAGAENARTDHCCDHENDAGESRLTCISHIRIADPSDDIAELARTLEADLVIVGTHGRTGLARLLLGSVASDVVTAAPCPVLVVREQAVPVQAPAKSSRDAAHAA